MPVPLPLDDQVDLLPPGADEVAAISRAIASIAAPATGLSSTQRQLLDAMVPAMTGFPADLSGDPLGPPQLADVLARRNWVFRTRVTQLGLLIGLVLHPMATDVVDRLEAMARELSVEEGMVAVAHRFAEGSLGLAAFDFQRNGYTADWDPQQAGALHTSHQLAGAWEEVVNDPSLAARWRALEDLPRGTLGRGVTEFYRARGFSYPGTPGSAPPLLAQHDWVHVLADYGSTVECELEVFGFIARANDDLRAFSLLAMVVSLFETGYLRTGAGGFFASNPGHLSRPGVAARLADGMRRGARCSATADLLQVDWFDLAHLSLADARDHFGVLPKTDSAIAAGSVGPWDPGGMSPFQLKAGQALAAQEGRRYDSFGASPG